MSKTYATCLKSGLAKVQSLILTALLVAGLAQTALATCTITGGTIGNAQTSCGAFDPTAITNVTGVTSPFGGPFAYIWLVTTDANAVAGTNTNWTTVSGAIGVTYDPGHITQTTWYRRCARRNVSGCPNYDGESNWIKMTVNAAVNATLTASSTITQGQSKTLTATGGGTYAWSTGATGASITVSPSATTTYTVTVTGTNGCTAVRTSTVTVTPATGVLTFNCQTNITVTAAAGANSAVVTYPSQTATSTCQIGTVTVARISGPASGTAFAVGTTQVCFRATDGCGNTKDCCFNVIVNPGTPAADCNNIGIVPGNGTITVNGVSGAPIVSIQVYDAAWNTVYNQFFTNSPGTVTIPSLTAGTYNVKVQYLTAAWLEICKKEMAVAVSGNPAPSISISDVTVNENAGTASLQICASAASTSPITVTYTTSNGTATAGADYTTTTATATIPAGQTCTTVTFPIIDNTTQEPTEAFNVTLSGPNGATIADGTGTVTILDNDNAPVPSISISDVTVNENAGTASLQICASAASTSPITVTYATSNGTATAGTDFTNTSSTATIPAGQTCTTVTFPITDDGTQEPTEMFNVTLSSPNGATIADGAGTVTILDNDNAPGADCATVVIAAGTGAVNISNMSNPGGVTIIQAYDANWNQVFNQYYTTTPASVSIPGLAGGNYFVKVQYLTSAWIEICKKEVTVTVGGGNPTPTISISDVTVNENAGTASLQICASAASTSPITVTYTTSNGTATAGADYTTTTATATIAAGQTCTTVTFPIIDNTTQEPTEAFNVTLSGPSGATIADGTGTVTILDNDNAPAVDCATIGIAAGTGAINVTNLSNPGGVTMIQAFDANWNQVFNQYYTTTPASVSIPGLAGGNYFVKVQYLTSAWVEICKKEVTVTVGGGNPTPTLSISDVTVNENAGTASLQICASAASTSPITVTYTTQPNTATAGADYTATTATATIPAGQTCVTITIPIVDNTTQEPTEVFHVYLSNPVGATIADLEGLVTILDNDNAPVPTISISDVTVNENAGTASLQICASAASTSPITVTYATSNGTATAGADYTTTTATATIAAGQTCTTVTFPITDDGTQEPTEAFSVTLSGPNGATIADGTGAVTILDNDNAPSVDCATVVIAAGTGAINVSNLSNPGGVTIIQAYDANWNPVFNQYYTTTPASVSIPGLAGGNYFVKVQYLTSAWVEICKKEVTITVGGGNPTPTISISDVTVNENAGTASLQICASAASTSPITVTYTTSNGTATSGSDYAATTATATIPAGQTCTTVTFPITDNTVQEPTEAFNVTLSGPNGATIADGTGTVTILDNDNAPQFDCTTATATVTGGNIVVGNLANAPIIIVQVADPSWNQIFNQYYTTNPGTVSIPTTVSGTYYVKIQYLNADWSEICKKEVYLPVVGAPTGVLTFPQPGNITMTAPQGATSMVVTYPTPTATSTCTVGTVTVTRVSGPASGSSFPVGTTAVCYRATDGCGNSIDRCFNVIVNAPAGPVCNITRNATNNSMRNSDCTVNGQGYGMWLNVTVAGTTNNHYSLSGTTFVENADGTATMTGVASNNQNANAKFNISVNFCGRTFAAPAGSPKAPCYTFNSNGWYYYTTACGTLTGTGAAAGLVVQITRRGEAFQVGTGANLNENVFGASGWFNTFVTSGTAAGLTEGDFNFNLSGAATAPACGTGTANCSTVACYTNPGGNFPDANACYRIVNKVSNMAMDSDNFPWLTQRPVDNSSSQSWRLVSAGAGYYYIKSNATTNNGKVVDIQNGSTANDAPADLVTQTGADCERYALQDAGNGFFYLVAKHSGKALKLSASPGVDGTSIIQQTISSTNEHQKWKFEVVTCTYAATVQSALSLSAQRAGKTAELRWMSTTGTKNDAYIVERQAAGGSFEVIATGNATSLNDVVYYNVTDAAPAKANNIYRVRMILKDGTERVSNEQTVFMPEVGSFGMYPNPAADRVTLDASDFVGQNVTVQIFNNLGKSVKMVEVSATTGLIELDLTEMTSGFYGVSIESNGVKRSSKLLVTKQ